MHACEHAHFRELASCNIILPLPGLAREQQLCTCLLSNPDTRIDACLPTHITSSSNFYDLLPDCCRRRRCRQMLRPELHARTRLGRAADRLMALPTDDLQPCRLICIGSM